MAVAGRAIKNPLGLAAPLRLDGTDAQMAGLVLMWGTAFAALKVLLETLDPYQLTWFRYLPFLVLYGLWLPVARLDRFRGVSGGDWVRFALAGALGVIGYHFPLNYAMHGEAAVTAATGSIMVATTPLWTLLLAVLLGSEGFSLRKATGSAVAFAGVVVIILLAPTEGRDIDASMKAAIALIAPLAWGAYSIVAKPLVGRHGGLFTTGLTFCLGTLMLLPIGIKYGVAPLAPFDAIDWGWLVFVSLGATVAGYTIWNHCLKRRSATELTAYIYFVPVMATIMGFLLVDEQLTGWFFVGAALVIAGVVQVNRARLAPGV